MIYIYFNDKNGTIYSADKQRCFSVVFGDDVYAFLRSEKNKEKRFYRTQTEETGGDTVLVEVPPEKVRTVRKEERRKQYVSDCMKNKEFTILHLGDMDSDDGITGEELIASLDESVDTLAIRNLDISTLRKALKTLNEKEYEVIASLHYASPPLTEAQLADRLGVHQSTISRRKNAAYRKIRKFFEISFFMAARYFSTYSECIKSMVCYVPRVIILLLFEWAYFSA